MSMRQTLDIKVEDVGNDGLLISLPASEPAKSRNDRERVETGREYDQVSTYNRYSVDKYLKNNICK